MIDGRGIFLCVINWSINRLVNRGEFEAAIVKGNRVLEDGVPSHLLPWKHNVV